MRRFTRVGLRGAALAWAAVSLLSLGASPAGAPAQGADSPGGPPGGFRKAAAKAGPAVVTVRAAGGLVRPPVPMPDGPDPFGRQDRLFRRAVALGSGSGVVTDAAKGQILTADSLVAIGPRVEVVLPDGRVRAVDQVRRDPSSGLALLVVDPKGLTAAEWADSDAVEPGDWVLAVSRTGRFGLAVSAGVVSAREPAGNPGSGPQMVVTDALVPVLGGPLVDAEGRVVAVVPAQDRMAPFPEAGRGFTAAVPAARAKRVAAELAREGRVRRAFLGVAVEGRPAGTGGAVVTEISPDSPAEKAKLKAGDVILKVGDRAINGPGDMVGAFEFLPVGEPVTLTIDRDGERREVEVRPAPRPDAPDFGRPREREPEPADREPKRERDSDTPKKDAPG